MRKPHSKLQGVLSISTFVLTSFGCGIAPSAYAQCISDQLLIAEVPPTTAPRVPAQVSSNLKLGTKTIDKESKISKIHVEYPEVKGNHPSALRLNQAIRKVIDNEVKSYQKEILPPESADMSKNDLYIGYEVSLANSQVLSILFNVSAYYAGAVHPTPSLIPLNLRTKDATVIKLEDMFAPGAKYLKTLAQISIPTLKAEIESPDPEWINRGAGPEKDNYQVFTLTEKGMDITFPQYQVDCYAGGPHTVSIPYTKLNGKLNPNNPLAKMLTASSTK